jgi:hypothetical protein
MALEGGFNYPRPDMSSRGPRSRVSAGGLFFDSLQGVVSLLATLLAFLFGFVAWVWAPTSSVPLWAVIPVCSIGALLVVALTDALRKAARMIAFGSFKVVAVKRSHAPYNAPPYKALCICIVEPSEPLRDRTTVSFHWDDNGYPRPVGIGHVVDEQDDGRAIVILETVHKDATIDDFVKRLCEGNKDAIDSLRARATVLQEYYGETRGEPLVPDPAALVLSAPREK